MPDPDPGCLLSLLAHLFLNLLIASGEDKDPIELDDDPHNALEQALQHKLKGTIDSIPKPEVPIDTEDEATTNPEDLVIPSCSCVNVHWTSFLHRCSLKKGLPNLKVSPEQENQNQTKYCFPSLNLLMVVQLLSWGRQCIIFRHV